MNNLSKRRRDEDSQSADNENPKKQKIWPKYPSMAKTSFLNPHELRKFLMPTLKKIDSGKGVKAKDLRMDLININNKLTSEEYSDPWHFVEDVWLMFENVWHSKAKTSRIYQYCTELCQKFEQEIGPVMQALGYCCGRRYTFDPKTLCCSAKESCTISIGADYFEYQTRSCICEKCFDDMPGDAVTLDEGSPFETTVTKDGFIKMKNVSTPEPFIVCGVCSRKQHQICVLYLKQMWPDGYVCDRCLTTEKAVRKENTFNAKNLPASKVDNHIEIRVNNFLKKKKVDAGRIHIRMLFHSNETVEVKAKMKNLYVESGELNADFPYRSKALFAFQEVDGVDVCFFGMYVQEYGSDCASPNTRKVYITFLDSVNFFAPKQYRTAVYHEILLGYMDYAKKLGFAMVHIWACPPPLGENYIFYSHPIDQKVPNAKRLQKWYKELFERGRSELIIEDYKDILQQAKADNLTSAAELSYFDHDFWPSFFEESIMEFEDGNFRSNDDHRKPNTSHKRSKSTRVSRQNNDSSIQHQLKRDLNSKLFETMEKHRGVFFVVTLHSMHSGVTLDPIRDPDSIMPCDFMPVNGHDAFFNFARDHKYEFSSLRRAKFSTLCILSEVHNREQYTYTYNCNNCEIELQTGYHCRVCKDFDLCHCCKDKMGHDHEMGFFRIDDQITLNDVHQATRQDTENGILPSDLQANVDTRKQTIGLLDKMLRHVYRCGDSNCPIQSCQIMKRAVKHRKFCKSNSQGCETCGMLNNFFYCHASTCQTMHCPYLFCNNLKIKLQHQQQLLRQRTQYDRRIRIAKELIQISLHIIMLPNERADRDHTAGGIHHVLHNAIGETAHVQVLLQELMTSLNETPNAKQIISVTPPHSTVQVRSSNVLPRYVDALKSIYDRL